MAGEHIVIVGGVSVNDSEHDGNPFNFINPGVRRAKALAAGVTLILYTPSYPRRVAGQKGEHESVENPKKNPDYFLKIVQQKAKENKFKLVTIASRQELTAALRGFTRIASIDYFGHSNPAGIFLEYSSIDSAVSRDIWTVENAREIKPSQFVPGAVFASYGCNQGDVGGLAETLRELWRIRTVGSRDKTNFKITGPFGGPTFPTSKGGYVEWPAPTVLPNGELERPLTPPRALTYEKSQPPH